MPMQVTREQMQRTFQRAKSALLEHKHAIQEAIKGVEAFAAPLAVGIAAGRLAKSGDGKVELAGIPLPLLLGVVGVGGSASGYLDDYGEHAGNMGAGFLGQYGAELGTEIGLVMRAKAGQPVRSALLPKAKLAEINAALAARGQALKEAAVGSEFTGEFNTLVGAAPQPLSPQQLEQMVREAQAATPGG